MGPLSGASLAAFYAFVALPDASLAAFYAPVAQMGGPVIPKLIQLTHFTHVLFILCAFWVKQPAKCGHPCASTRHLCAQNLPLCSAAVLSKLPFLLESRFSVDSRRAPLIDPSSDCTTNICLERYSYALGGGWV